MKININVIRSDIDNGVKNNSEKCVVARAIDRRLYAKYFVKVEHEFIDIIERIKEYGEYEYSQRVHRIHTPGFISDYIEEFDSLREVKPIKFPLNIPKKYLRAS